MIRRRALYWALWPLEKVFLAVAWLGPGCRKIGRPFYALIIASNPLLLAMWILRRDKRRQEEDK